MGKRLLLFACVLGIATGIVSAGWAQDYIPNKEADKLDKELMKKKQGWIPYLSIGGNVSFGHSHNVVGSANGASWTLGLNLDGRIALNRLPHEWRNKLQITETFTRTPAIPRFTKSADALRFNSIYLYHIKDLWFGPFASLTANTALFHGFDDRAATTTYQITELDGRANLRAGTRLQTSKPFTPTTLKEAVGFFAQPFQRRWLNIELRLGIGANQTFVDRALALDDNADTKDIIEYKRLRDFSTVGIELEAEFTGKFRKIITYSVSGDLYYPFYKSIPTDLSQAQRLHVEIEAKLGVKLASWASLDYVLTAKRLPFLSREWQVQNGLLLSIAFVVGK
ncbi:MAG: DUF3078 domain-containing protein [Myxococcales bacterium]|nr:DUF3078 domain-containing protein [Myxococcales bacterium]